MDDPTTAAVTEGFGLMFYNARWYDPYLNHFTQPDTIVPDPYNSLDWNRYAYTRYNPIRYIDPSGHMLDDGCRTSGCATDMEKIDWRLRIILAKSKSGDVLQTKLKNGNNAEFVFTNDPNGALVLWNVSEGRAWEGILALQYLSQNITDAGLFQMNSDGSYSLLRDRHNFIGSLDSYVLPYPIQAQLNANKGIQLGSPEPGSSLPPGFDNGDLFYHKDYDGYDASKIVISVVMTFVPWPPAKGAAIVSLYFAVEDFYDWLWHDWEITDVTYNPGLNPPYNPLAP